MIDLLTNPNDILFDSLDCLPSDDAPHILVVDDDRRVRALLKRYLMRHNYRITLACDAAAAHRQLAGLDFDLIILDLMLPGEGGLSFAASTRKENIDVPILMLSARTSRNSCIESLEAGADDFMNKPFEPRELLLRVSNWIKRIEKTDPAAIEKIVFGDYIFVHANRELKKNGKPISLTEREKDILFCLTKIPGEPISRDDLTSQSSKAEERTIDVQINHLRRKIEPDPTNPQFIQTVRGKGYQMVIG